MAAKMAMAIFGLFRAGAVVLPGPAAVRVARMVVPFMLRAQRVVRLLRRTRQRNEGGRHGLHRKDADQDHEQCALKACQHGPGV